jgi:cell wall-associated NlpC family hydrolase
MAYAADLVGLCLKQVGDRYVFGHRVSLSNRDPDVFDCSELVQWACARLGVTPTMPDGSWLQARHCNNHQNLIPVEEGKETQGALLFKFSSNPLAGDRPTSAHVAISLGNGNTVEARGTNWGVGSWSAVQGRNWTHAALIPGILYEAPPDSPLPIDEQDADPDATVPAWPGRFLIQPPIMVGQDVRQWQEQMINRGFLLEVDGEYGYESEGVCRSLQQRSEIQVDGIVGPDTWRASWVSGS